MANQIGDTVSKGNYFNVCTDETKQTFETKSFYTDSGDVSFADGENAENKVGAIKGITSDFNTTDSGYAASMTAVSKLNSSLESNNEHFYYDVQNGVRGFNTDPARGADTFHPFNRINGEIVYNPSGLVKNYTLNASPNSYYLIQCISFRNDGIHRRFIFTGAEIIFTAMSTNYYNTATSITYIVKATSNIVDISVSAKTSDEAMFGVVISKLT